MCGAEGRPGEKYLTVDDHMHRNSRIVPNTTLNHLLMMHTKLSTLFQVKVWVGNTEGWIRLSLSLSRYIYTYIYEH